MAFFQTIFLLLLLTVEQSTGQACPEGWFNRLNECYYYGKSVATYNTASLMCRTLGAELRVIRNDLQNRVLLDGTDINDYWIGIQRANAFSPWKILGNETVTYNKMTIDQYRRNHCMVWRAFTGGWSIAQCNIKHRYICQKHTVCSNGFYGEKCKEECHCRQGTCDQISGICPGSGCQLGWHGSNCNLEKKRAVAKFYCFKERGTNGMIFRVNQRNTTYRYVTAVDTEGNAVKSCMQDTFRGFKRGGLATLKVHSTDKFNFTPSCGEDKESEDMFSWRFKFQEHYDTESLYDIVFRVHCDFKSADNMERSMAFNHEDRLVNLTTVLQESKVSVSLEVIDPFSGEKILSSRLGQSIALKLSLSNAEEYGVSAITPYDCSVGTLDRKHEVVIADAYGCKPKYAQVYFLKTNNVTWGSEQFETFSFPGYSQITFRCHFHVCFSDDDESCTKMCTNMKRTSAARGHARNIAAATEKPRTVGTTLNVV